MAGVRHWEAMGRRVKAAATASGRELQDVKPQLAALFGVRPRTVDRILAGDRRLEDELEAVAVIVSAPVWYLRDGYAGAPTPEVPPDEVALAAVKDLTDALRQQSAALERALQRLDQQELREAATDSA